MKQIIIQLLEYASLIVLPYRSAIIKEMRKKMKDKEVAKIITIIFILSAIFLLLLSFTSFLFPPSYFKKRIYL